MLKDVSISMLSADFGNLERDVKMIGSSKAGWMHIDVMDGVFVPNISFGFPVLKAMVDANERLIVDTHLMITEPERYLKRFAEAGSDYITFHIEATYRVRECIDIIHGCGARAGLSIKPGTDISVVEPFLSMLDMVLVMSVEPGFGGQKFIEASLEKVVALREMIDSRNLDTIIEVDGGIGSKNAAGLYAAGANILVAGNAVFKAEDPLREIELILGL